MSHNPSDRYFPRYNAYRCGLCDAIMGRDANSPWKDLGFKAFKRNTDYLAGYLQGQKTGVKFNG